MSFLFLFLFPSPRSSVGSVKDSRVGGRWFESPDVCLFFLKTNDSHCDKIHSSLIVVHCFDDAASGQWLWKEYCEEHWLKELQENMDMCTCRREVTGITLKTELKVAI